MKDEKKHHGAVDESSSEQQLHKLNAITYLCCVQQGGSLASRLAVR